ncbi:oligosaccharide flippase family protein [Clostridium senegalense]|uniref:oligosaccharide flippase family protein n=1 Tax=Clostridium senegalense TaxID=1465809 RepID=UPI00031EC66A|nr:oligosaccharide flippase family protein [Clostridium senegalense]
MIFVYPYFAKKCDDKNWVKAKYIKLQRYLAIINGLISIICIVFAPIIIKIIFGSEYLNCISAFRILWVGYFIAGTFRVPSGNVLFTIKKKKLTYLIQFLVGF